MPTQISAYQNRLKKFITPLLLIAIASSSAMDMVRSKSDALWLVQRPDGSGTTCKMEYGEPAETVTEKNGLLLINTFSNCMGWTKKSDLTYIPQDPRPRSPALLPHTIDICTWRNTCSDPRITVQIRKAAADSVALYTGDSTILDYANQDNGEKSSPFITRFEEITDSLYKAYISNLSSKIEHWSFFKYAILKKRDNIYFARMEWDSIPTAFHLEHNPVFDSIYAANRNMYLDSLKKIDPLKRWSITLSMMEYEKESEELQAIADSLGRLYFKYGKYDSEFYKKLYTLQKMPHRIPLKDGYWVYGGFEASFSHLQGSQDSIYGEFIGLHFLLGMPTRIGTFALSASINFGINKGSSFKIPNEKDKTDSASFEHNAFVPATDFTLLYRPIFNIHDKYNMWAVQPEIGVGYYDFDKDVYYYSLGIRYERSVESLNYRLHNWPGIINGWSVGISAKMKYAHFLGVTADVRFAFHPSY